MTNREKAYFRIITGLEFSDTLDQEYWKDKIQLAKDCAAEEERMIREAFEKSRQKLSHPDWDVIYETFVNDYLKTIKE